MRHTVTKKVISVLLAAVMLLGIAPLSELAGFDTGFMPKAEAAELSKYSATAAAEWAKAHVYDYNSILLGTGYYTNGGDCANFVSQCLYMGGLDMDELWNTSGYFCHWNTYWNGYQLGSEYQGSYIRCDQLYRYLQRIGGQVIRNPSASQLEVGDVLIYCDSTPSDMTHSAIVIDVDGGVPNIAAHSVDGSDWAYTSKGRGWNWHLRFTGDHTFLIKLHGSTCEAKNPRSFDVYTAARSTRLYNAPNTWSGYQTTYLTGEYTHIFSTSGNWGYTFRYGRWGWVNLNDFYYQRHVNSPDVTHLFGDWTTVTVANCTQDGLDKKVCRRCGYTLTRTTKGGHITDPAATCLTPGVCKICGVQTQDPLGHDWNDGTVTTDPTCTETGVRTYVCNRDASHTYTEEIPALGHDYIATPTAPTCTQDGISTMTCSRCSDTYVVYTNESNTWSEWTTDTPQTVGLSGDKVRTKTQWRYSDKETTTKTNQSTLSGWTQYNLTKAPGEWSAWSGWQDAAISETWQDGYKTREVETRQVVSKSNYKTQYNYSRYTQNSDGSGQNGPVAGTWSGIYCGNYKERGWSDTALSVYSRQYSNQYKAVYGGDGYFDMYGSSGNTWYNQWTQQVWVSDEYKTQYRSRTRSIIYTYYFYRWKDWSTWQDTSVASSDSRKVETRTVYSYDLAALGHDFSVCADKAFATEPRLLTENELTSVCYTQGWNCSRCGAFSPDSEQIRHSFPVWNSETKEGYTRITEDGAPVDVYRAYCANGCGCWYDVTVNNCVFTAETVSPTCMEDGYTVHTCSVHGETYQDEYVPALGHDTENSEWRIVSAPSCEENGVKRRECVRFDACGYYEEEVIPAIGHDLKKHDAVPETCLTDGNTEYYECSVCGKFFSDAEGENELAENDWVISCAGSHVDSDEGRWVTVREAKCGVSKLEECYCTRELSDGSVCGALIDERESEITEHNVAVVNAVNAVQNDDGEWVGTRCDEECYIEFACTNTWNGEPCDMPHYTRYLPVEHTPETERTEPVCVHAGHYVTSCTVCGTILDEGSIDAEYSEHEYEIKETIPSPCAAADGIRHYVCTRCGETDCVDCAAAGTPHHYWDGEQTNHNIVKNETKSTPASCVKNGEDVFECINDGCDYSYTVIVPPHGHIWDDGTEINATCTEQGYIHYTCTVCGEEYDKYTDPACGHDYSGEYSVQTATCTEDGLEELHCVRVNSGVLCDELLERQVIPAHGHDYQKIAEKSLAPDYGVEGYDYYECSYDASHNYKVTIPALIKNTYTVTFVADGEIVAVVPYAEGDKFVDEPDIPEKDNFTSAWEDYELNNENITVNAVYTPIDLNDISDIETEKTVDKYENGTATITLSASAATRAVRITRTTKKPVDVIMVLDRSGSMNEELGEGVTETKLEALKACAVSFIEKVNKAGTDNRIALVGFASGEKVDGYSIQTNQNTGLLVTEDGGFVSYSNASDKYCKALLSAGDIAGVNQKLTEAINGMTAEGSTNTQLGLKMAQGILGAYESDGREKVVILLTDGNPTSAASHKDEILEVAPLAVTFANQIKASGVKLYTVGVDANADENAAFDSSVDGITGTGETDQLFINGRIVEKEEVSYDFNRFLNIVSTNYPDAKAMNDYGEKKNSGYYMSVRDTSKLDEIFSKILVSSVDKPVAFTKCTIVDTLTADFVLTMEQETAFREKMAKDYNIPDSSISVERKTDGTTVIRVEGVPAVRRELDGKTVYTASVTFDASLKNYEAGEYYTNTVDAYAEVGGENAGAFDIPAAVTVNSDRNIIVFKINGEIYRIEEGSLGDAVTAPETDLATWAIPEGTVITGNYAEFEATELASEVYTVTWDIDGNKTTENYTFGQVINVREVPDKPDFDFAGFCPAVPHIMPARNMTFTALYVPKHIHQFRQTSYYGSCKSGLVIVSTCVCGETKETRSAVREHSFGAVVVGDMKGNTLTDSLICSVCGSSENHTLRFRTRAAGGRYYLDLNMEQNGVKVQPAEGTSVKIMVPWTNQGKQDTTVQVYRVNESGAPAYYTATIEDGYLVFYADHFSIYVIDEDETAAPVSLKFAECGLNGSHNYEMTDFAEPTCTENGYMVFTCTVCGDSYTEAGEKATGHTDANNDGVCDTCNEQTDDGSNSVMNKCKWCGKVHTGFFGKLIEFFHNILYFFAHLFGKK